MATVVDDEEAGALRFWFASLYGLGAVASALTILSKIRLLIHKLLKRNSNLRDLARQQSNAMAPGEWVAKLEDDDDLDDRLDSHKKEVQEALSCILLAFAEDLPMVLQLPRPHSDAHATQMPLPAHMRHSACTPLQPSTASPSSPSLLQPQCGYAIHLDHRCSVFASIGCRASATGCTLG